MITRFHATGASAGTLKCSNELSIPTTSPESASSITIGNISRARSTVSSWSAGSSSKPGANTLMIGSANRMNSAVSAPRTRQIRKNRLDATWNASLRSPFSSSSVKTGTNAPWRAESANRARIRFGTWKAIVNADIAPLTPKYLAATTSRTSPSTRERPVASEKNAVLRASAARRVRAGGRGASASRYIGRRARLHVASVRMANIASQKSGSIGRSASASRTGAALRRSRPTSAASRPRSAPVTPRRADEEFRSLVSRIDRAVKRAPCTATAARARRRARRACAAASP